MPTSRAGLVSAVVRVGADVVGAVRGGMTCVNGLSAICFLGTVVEEVDLFFTLNSAPAPDMSFSVTEWVVLEDPGTSYVLAIGIDERDFAGSL